MTKTDKKSLWKLLAVYAVIMVVVSVALYVFAVYYMEPKAAQGGFYYHSVDVANADDAFAPEGKFQFSQTFEATDSIFGYEIRMRFTPEKQAERALLSENEEWITVHDKLTVSLLDSSGNVADYYELSEEEVNYALKVGTIQRYYYGNTITGGVRGQTYTLLVEGDFRNDAGIEFPISDRDYYRSGALHADNVDEGRDLCFLISSYSYTMIMMLFCAFSVALLLAITVIYFCAFIFRCKKHILFLITVLIMGIGYSMVMAPYMVTDEERHFQTAYRFANILTFTEEKTDDPGHELYMRACDLNTSDLTRDIYGRYFIPSVSSYAAVINTAFDRDINTEMVLLQSERVSGNYTCYLASGVGIALGKALHLSFPLTFYLGRMMNLLLFAVLGMLAVKKTPFGKNIFFAIALMPLVLQQAASYSYDSITMGFAFYFIATCLDIAYHRNRIGILQILQIVACAAVFCAARAGVLIVLLPLVLLVLWNPKLPKKQKWMLVAVTAAAGIVFLAAFNYWRLESTSTSSTDTQLYTIDFILKYPKEFVKLLLNTYFVEKERWFYSLFGSYLSWVNLQVEKTFALVFAAFLLISATRCDTSLEVPMRKWDKAVFAPIVALVIIGFFAAGFLWTDQNSPYITGVETRYVLTVLPLILLLLQNNALICRKDITRFLTVALVLTNGIYLVDALKVILLA